MDFLDECEMNMMKAIDNLEARLITVRAGRANASMLNGIMVEYYGAPTPINQVANITVPEARQLFIKPFDRSIIKDIERAINEANIGITPTNNGEMVILTVPQLTEETRRNYVKQVDEMGEQAKIALRNARQDANNDIKKNEELTEDDKKRYQDDVQEIINKYNKIVDEKIKEQTQFIKLLTADAEHLMSSSKTAELKAEAKKVYEAIRYSDPMSNEALADIEGQIQSEFAFFTQAIRSEDLELAKSVADGLLNLIDARNKKCKVLK